MRTTASSGELRIADNRSRLGVSGYKFVARSTYIFTRIELGTDLGGTVDGLLLPSDNPPEDAGTVFLRVGEVGVSTKWGDFSVGKQWSVYYDVSGYTDRFAVFGAQGTATYNAGTDGGGGGSGTGRADQAFMYRTHGSSKLTLGLQLQNNGNIPLADSQKYNGAGGASLSYEFSPEWSAAAAYNHSVIKELDQELRDLGLTGDSQAAVLGVQYFHDAIYIATTFARHKNHETTNEGKYIDANGWELYGRYQINKRIRAVAGANYLDPDKNDPDAGQYKIRAGILGMQYTYRDIKIGDIIYFEMELRGGRQVDGARSENAYTLGFRYSFEL